MARSQVKSIIYIEIPAQRNKEFIARNGTYFQRTSKFSREIREAYTIGRLDCARSLSCTHLLGYRLCVRDRSPARARRGRPHPDSPRGFRSAGIFRSVGIGRGADSQCREPTCVEPIGVILFELRPPRSSKKTAKRTAKRIDSRP